MNQDEVFKKCYYHQLMLPTINLPDLKQIHVSCAYVRMDDNNAIDILIRTIHNREGTISGGMS